MTRRSFVPAAASGTLAMASPGATIARKGRLKQSVCKWCYRDMTVEALAREGQRLGLKGIDLIGPADWPAVQKYGLIPTMAPSGATIPDGFNRRENHDRLEKQMQEALDLAAKAGAPNVITFSGNRRGMSDEEGLDNCVIGLNRVKAMAEDKGVTICMELLNSKVNHPDYMCDKTAWGVEMVKRVNSPRVKLLYDIYHMQIMEGDVIRTIRDNFQYIGHYHTGGNPGRNEIDSSQELNYAAIAKAIVDLGFQGYFAHEFIPKRDPVTSLSEATDLCDI